MIEYLAKNGYTIKKIKTWKSYNTYHNQVENSYSDVEIALQGDLDEFNSPDGSYRDDSVTKYKIESVFKNCIKSKLLNL